MNVCLHVGDCLEVLAELPECSVDACITDPPYGIGFMGADWDKARTLWSGGKFPNGSPKWTGAERDAFEQWTERWAALALRALKPGGAILAFSSCRTYHWTARGMENAGCEPRDMIQWSFGSGFPKSHNGPWGGTALKPAHEPVALMRKPLDGTHAANWERWGTGGIDVDAMRVPLGGDTVPEFADDSVFSPEPGRHGPGRRVVGKRGGETKAKNVRYTDRPQADGWGTRRCETEQSDEGRWPANVVHDGSDEVLEELPDSGGSAARFFYCAKPSKGEKEAGLDGLPRKQGGGMKGRLDGSFGGTKPRMSVNVHPTCKPIELMRWLVRGFAPAGGVVLDPFLGSGTTAVAAVLEGRRWIGIERDPEYAAIAQTRIEWWAREAARKPGRSVAEVLGESRPAPRPAPESRQGSLLP